MGKVALYRHYRSHDFSDLVGQPHVASTLERAVTSGQITHAYLFTGPHGVGKTSAARIFARRVNQVEEAAHHPDIIEIDAASNNGVEEIRELREKVHVAPNYAKYKIYIIDEVHMLSTAAFNALLKTLEEPPAHVIFVLATTEPHKIPQTIISRTQHFPFRPISHAATTKHLEAIAKKEKIAITPEAVALLAELGEGSMRDSISLLDQVGTGSADEVTVEAVEELIGLARTSQVKSLVSTIESNQPAEVLAHYDELLSSGTAPQLLLKQLLLHTRGEIRQRLQKGEDTRSLRQILQTLSTLTSRSAHLEFAIEAALLQLSTASSPPTAKASKNFKSRISPKNIKSEPEKIIDTIVHTEKQDKPVPSHKPVKPGTKLSQKDWLKSLSIIKQRHASLFALLTNSHVDLDQDICTITAKFQFHFRRLDDTRARQAITETLSEASGRDIEVKILSPHPKAKSAEDTQDESEQAVAEVTKILGGEVIYG